jgi:hypothetical protein
MAETLSTPLPEQVPGTDPGIDPVAHVELVQQPTTGSEAAEAATTQSAEEYRQFLYDNALAEAAARKGLSVADVEGAVGAGIYNGMIADIERSANDAVASFDSEVNREILTTRFQNELSNGADFHVALDTTIAEGAHLADFQWGDQRTPLHRPETLADVQANTQRSARSAAEADALLHGPYHLVPGAVSAEAPAPVPATAVEPVPVVATAPAQGKRHLTLVPAQPAEGLVTPPLADAAPEPVPSAEALALPWYKESTPRPARSAEAVPGSDQSWAFGEISADNSGRRPTDLGRHQRSVNAARQALEQDAFEPAAGYAEAAAVAAAPVRVGDVQFLGPDGQEATAEHPLVASRPHPHRARAERGTGDDDASSVAVASSHQSAAPEAQSRTSETDFDDPNAPRPSNSGDYRGHPDTWGQSDRDAALANHSVDLDTAAEGRSQFRPYSDDELGSTIYTDEAEPLTPDEIAARDALEAAMAAPQTEQKPKGWKKGWGYVRTKAHGLRGAIRGDNIQPPEAETIPAYDLTNNPDYVRLEDGSHQQPGAYELPRGGLSKRAYRKLMTEYYNGKLEDKPGMVERIGAVNNGLVSFEDDDNLENVNWVEAKGPAPAITRERRDTAARDELLAEMASDVEFRRNLYEEVAKKTPQHEDETKDEHLRRIDEAYVDRFTALYNNTIRVRDIAEHADPYAKPKKKK